MKDKLTKLGKLIRENRSFIFSGLGIGGFVFSSIRLAKSSYVAGSDGRKLKPKEIAIPAIVDVVSAASILTGNVLDKRDKAVLAASYIFLDAARRRFQDAKKNTQRNDDQIETAARVAAKQMGLVPDEIMDDGRLWHDPISDVIFFADMRTVLGAEFLINRQLTMYECADAADWIYYLGIEVTDEELYSLSDKVWDVGVSETFFDKPNIEFWHVDYVDENGKPITVGEEHILDIHMSYFPKEA